MKIYFIIATLFILINSKDTHDQVRTCITQSLSSTSKCKNQYTKCFDDIDCNNQFDDLFRNCVIQGGSSIYESYCVNMGFAQISNALLSDLFDCLVRQCNIMQGKLNHIKLFSNVSECFSDALLDSSKCWIQSKNCSQQCEEQLNMIADCETHISKNDVANTRKCLDSKSFTDTKAKEIKQCLMLSCL
ncbi:unnamed protein product [Paramecium octaurelia]|uniref:Uncharacterized protein n=1 Tax=Paramecium octaurelia TaxID=43137 RepID=A0A8S1U142_PAROT|nr:unnamed protein product [Paramecium octaurelia]